MTRPRSTLALRLLVLALAQMAMFTAAAVIIWYFTAPHGGPPAASGPPALHEHPGPPEIPTLHEHPGPPGPPALHEHPGPPGPPQHPGPPGRPASDAPGGLFHEVPWGPILTLTVGFLVLAVGAILTARWLVRPIESLSRTAAALGDGNLAARSGIARDDELGELARRIDQMGENIEQMLQHERELLANVAHELRTPLARIGVAIDLANEGSASRARSSLAEIAVDVGELEVIVDDVLTALRYDVTRGASLPLRRALTPPAAIAEVAHERMRGRHPERPVEVTVADGLPDIDVDPVLFRRVIDNLLDNAHKYTPDRASPILLVVRLVARNSQRRVEFEVIDRGMGIATTDLPNVYHPFFRADRSRAREAGTSGGVGLGLTLAKRIVEAHGGTIELVSGTGKGTRAQVSVPVPQATQ
jgi:signal transduction histidine kinase